MRLVLAFAFLFASCMSFPIGVSSGGSFALDSSGGKLLLSGKGGYYLILKDGGYTGLRLAGKPVDITGLFAKHAIHEAVEDPPAVARALILFAENRGKKVKLAIWEVGGHYTLMVLDS